MYKWQLLVIINQAIKIPLGSTATLVLNETTYVQGLKDGKGLLYGYSLLQFVP